MKTKMKVLALSLVALGLSACGGGGAGGGGPVVQSWYDVYGNYCGQGNPGPGCNFYANGTKIEAYEDPYFTDPSWGWDATITYAVWDYYDSYGFAQQYTGWGWLSATNVLYDEFGYALNQGEKEESKDLVTEYANKEAVAVKKAASGLTAKYALAEDVSLKIAKTLNGWATLGKKRARNLNDLKAVTKNLYGVNFSDAEKALKNVQSTGNLKELAELNNQVAVNWGTNPETSKAILSKWFERQVKGFQ